MCLQIKAKEIGDEIGYGGSSKILQQAHHICILNLFYSPQVAHIRSQLCSHTSLPHHLPVFDLVLPSYLLALQALFVLALYLAQVLMQRSQLLLALLTEHFELACCLLKLALCLLFSGLVGSQQARVFCSNIISLFDKRNNIPA